MRSPYVYSESLMKRVVSASYNEDDTLHSIHGYKVGSYVTLEPYLLKAFRQHKFSADFLKEFGTGVFQVLDVQPDILYDNNRRGEIAVLMDSKYIVSEMLQFARENRELLHSYGWDDTPVHYFSLDIDCVEPVREFLSASLPKASL